MKNELLLCTVIFSQNIPYLESFFDSVSNQDTLSFDFLIINEDVDITQYTKWTNNATILQSIGNPIENRLQMIRYAKEKQYKYITWQDSDDMCSPERITTILEEIGDYDVLVHDMRIVDNVGDEICESFIGERFCNMDICFEDIKYKNFIGFGNTAVRVDCLSSNMYIPESIKAVDWWIGCSLALDGNNIKYIDKRLSDYRQYDSNLAHLKISSTNQLKKQLGIINAHYIEIIKSLVKDKVLQIELKQHNQKIEMIINKFPEEELKSTLLASFKDEYTSQSVWWEEINDIIKGVNYNGKAII
ncbi:hypothetical protein JCM17380_44770 [Desulfosporosinus burensis]